MTKKFSGIHVLILKGSSKSFEQSAIFCLSIWRTQHFKNILFANFYPIWRNFEAAAKINNDILKECRNITKITDPNLGFFLVKERIPRKKFLQNLKIIDLNRFLSIEIACIDKY